MIWVILSVLAGFGDAVSFAMMKKLGKLDAYIKLMFYSIITLPFLLFGFFYFREKNFKQAIIGSTIMFIGAILITLS